MDGLQLLQRVKADPRFKDLPVLMISSMPPEEATVRSLGLGAADFIPKPFRVRELLARVKAHLRVGRELNQARAEARSRSEMMDILQEVTASLKPDEIYQILVRRVAQGLSISRCSIVIAGPDDETGTVVAAFENPMLRNLPVDLAALSRDPAGAHHRRGGADPGRDHRPALPGRPPGNGSRGDRWRPARPSRSGSRSGDSRPACSSSGPPPRTRPLNEQDVQFAEQVINAAVAALEKAYDLESAVMGQEQMRHLAETDPLTSCFNRRALMEKLEQEMDRAARYATMLTGMMIDIDNFKQINDTHGHLVGDRVLKQLANLLKREQRSVDIVARYGGEEFVVLLPETTAAESRNFAERILRRVATHDFGEAGQPVRVTISVGIASYPDERVTDGESLLRLADTPPLPRQERRPEPVSRLSIRRCPRCQTSYPAPARFCVKDGSPLVEVERRLVRRPRRPRPRPDPADPGAARRGREDLPLTPRSSIATPPWAGSCSTGGTRWTSGWAKAGCRTSTGPRTPRPTARGASRSCCPGSPAIRRRSSGSAARRRSPMRLDHPNVCPILRLGESRTACSTWSCPTSKARPLSERETRRGPIPLSRRHPAPGPGLPRPPARARASASSIATSSPKTSCSCRTGRPESRSTARWSWTSGWPRSGGPGPKWPS